MSASWGQEKRTAERKDTRKLAFNMHKMNSLYTGFQKTCKLKTSWKKKDLQTPFIIFNVFTLIFMAAVCFKQVKRGVTTFYKRSVKLTKTEKIRLIGCRHTPVSTSVEVSRFLLITVIQNLPWSSHISTPAVKADCVVFREYEKAEIPFHVSINFYRLNLL